MVPGLGVIAAAGPIARSAVRRHYRRNNRRLVDWEYLNRKAKDTKKTSGKGQILFSMETDEDKVDAVSSILRSCGALSVRNP